MNEGAKQANAAIELDRLRGHQERQDAYNRAVLAELKRIADLLERIERSTRPPHGLAG